MTITIIAAMDRRLGIGKDQKIPWRLSSDLKRFKQLTMGHHIVMGRKTFESIGRALPGRQTVIITRGVYAAEGCDIVHSLDEAIGLCERRGEAELFICGGGEIYAEALPLTDRLYLTLVDAIVEADTFFPPINPNDWIEVASEQHPAGEKDEYSFTFRQLERKRDRNHSPDSRP